MRKFLHNFDGNLGYLVSVILLSILLLFLFNLNYSNAQTFADLDGGTNGPVIASTVYNGELVIAGDFTTAGGNSANYIAKWNGAGWTGIGTGMNAPVIALAIYNGELYAGGVFTTAGGNTATRIAKWNGSSWSGLGLGVNDTVFSIEPYGEGVVAGGSFNSAGGVVTNHIAFWNGSWSALGSGTSATVYSLEIYNGELVAGGSFLSIGGIPVNRIARWSGSNWQTLGNGVTGLVVTGLRSYDGKLVVGGLFSSASGTPANNVAMWNGSGWSAAGSGLDSIVSSFCIYLGKLYAGGDFVTAGGSPVNHVARYDGSSWGNIGGTSGTVFTMGYYDGTMISGGNFLSAGGVAVNNIAMWGSVPAAPSLISPVNNAMETGLTPTLDWSDIENASRYGVQLSDDPNFFTTILDVNNLTSSEYSVPSGLLNNNTIYFWRANASNGLGDGAYSPIWFFSSITTNLNITSLQIPDKFNLYNNYPNPFNPSTKIRFDIPYRQGGTNVRLVVYSQLGEEVGVLVNERLTAGSFEYIFDGSNLSSGIYFYSLVTDEFVQTSKMVLIK